MAASATGHAAPGAAADLLLTAPLAGWATSIDEIPDPVFAERMIGDGVAIDPVGTMLHAPCDAVVVTIHPAGHAITLRTAAGAEILIHLGMDTVALAGDGFAPRVVAGQAVRRGDPLIGFDLDALLGRVASVATPIVVTNPDRFTIERRSVQLAVAVGDPLMTIVATAAQADARSAAAPEHRRTVRVPLPHGIHARPAARIGVAIRDLDAAVTLSCDGRHGDARSTVGLLALGVDHGATVTIDASGRDAQAAVEAIAALIASGMGETATLAAPLPCAAAPLPPGAVRGVTAAPGLAIGPAHRLRVADVAIPPASGDPAHEQAALDAAIEQVRARLARRSDAGSGGAIMAAHLALLDDPLLHRAAHTHIAAGSGAGHGWHAAIATQVDALVATRNPRLAERADDLRDVERQVRRALARITDEPGAFPQGGILVADDLLPSQLVALADHGVAALCIARGGPTSHVAILAAGMGIPALVAIGDALDRVADGATLIVDADAAQMTVAPGDAALAAARARVAATAARKHAARAAAQDDCRTRDGVRIQAFANLASLADATRAVAAGAEGCGLLRTEFLFLDRATAPDEAEQTAAYQAIADALGDRPLIVRLLDIGGDKPAPYLALSAEENPALGVRGIRVGLAHPALLDTQLRAILGVVPRGRCKIMVPMIASLDELRLVRAALDRARADLGVEQPVALGIMIETPAAAMTADLLAAEADFLSIGSNDLTQYALAMDRGNAGVAAAIDGLHPAVLRLIDQSCRGGAVHGRWTGVCGGLASDLHAVPILIGLGVTELSATPALLPDVKALVRSLTLDQCRAHAIAALALPSAAAVRAHAVDFAAARR